FLVRLELNEFERTGADRMLAHVARRNMTGIGRGISGSEQREKGRLRPSEMKCDLVMGVTASRFRYQDLRGLTRSFSLALPVSRSQVHWTSLAVKGLPSCHVMPWRSGSVNSVPSSFDDQPVARSGTIESRLFCLTCWSNMTRLLKTPIIGRSETIVASSWIDMLAGLSGLYIFRMPPCFCANAGSAANVATSNDAATAKASRRC